MLLEDKLLIFLMLNLRSFCLRTHLNTPRKHLQIWEQETDMLIRIFDDTMKKYGLFVSELHLFSFI